jgi:hypothetical protein
MEAGRFLRGGAVNLTHRWGHHWATTRDGLLHSGDGGGSWLSEPGLASADSRIVQRDPVSLWAISGSRIFRADSGTTVTWTEDRPGLPQAGIRALSVAGNMHDPSDPGLEDPNSPTTPRIRDFCPLKTGYSWTYSRKYSAGRAGTAYQEKAIRSFQVASDSLDDTVHWYRVRMSDSVVEYHEHIGNIPVGKPYGKIGKDRALAFLVKETPDGALRIAFGDSLPPLSEDSVMVAYAFQARAVAPYWISDTSADHSQPEMAYSPFNSLIFRDVCIRKDIGLLTFNSSHSFANPFMEDVQYSLLRSHGERDYVSVHASPRNSPKSQIRPIRFTGRDIRARDRRIDGRFIR